MIPDPIGKENGYSDLQLIKGFSHNEFPYALAKANSSIILIDLKRNEACNLIQTLPMELW